jgi:hypothetical protein
MFQRKDRQGADEQQHRGGGDDQLTVEMQLPPAQRPPTPMREDVDQDREAQAAQHHQHDDGQVDHGAVGPRRKVIWR